MISKRGIDIEDINEVIEANDGTVEYEGHRILVYIRDQYLDREGNPPTTYRYHVAECRTLENMRRDKRFGRYVATNRKDGSFVVNYLGYLQGSNGDLVQEDLEVELHVCKNCLRRLDWQGYETSHARRDQIWRSFTPKAFFDKYETQVERLPVHDEYNPPDDLDGHGGSGASSPPLQPVPVPKPEVDARLDKLEQDTDDGSWRTTTLNEADSTRTGKLPEDLKLKLEGTGECTPELLAHVARKGNLREQIKLVDQIVDAASNARKQYSVYVIELDRSVLKRGKFTKANPEHDHTKECLYVGKTKADPEERFREHMKGGMRSSSWVRNYGQHPRPDLYQHYNPMTQAEAEKMEPELADQLRKEGYAVWWN